MKKSVLAGVLIGVCSLAGVIAFRTVVRSYRLPSDSMAPALPAGTSVVVVRATHPRRGDIVAFRDVRHPRVTLLSRVVAIGGDTVQIIDKRLLVNGRVVTEPYVVHSDREIIPDHPTLPEPWRSRDQLRRLTVPRGSFFVLGDNRDLSNDSRYFGAIPEENLIGRVVWPSSRARSKSP